MNQKYQPQEFVDLAVNIVKSTYKGQTPELRRAGLSDLNLLHCANRFSEAYVIGDLTRDQFNIHFEAGVVKIAKFDGTPNNADEVASSEPSTSTVGYFTRNEHYYTTSRNRRHRYITIKTKDFKTVSSVYDLDLPILAESDLKGLPLEEAVGRIVTLARM